MNMLCGKKETKKKLFFEEFAENTRGRYEST